MKSLVDYKLMKHMVTWYVGETFTFLNNMDNVTSAGLPHHVYYIYFVQVLITLD